MIETERLIIRRYKEKDFNDFWEIFSNNNVTKEYGLGAFTNKYDALSFFEGRLKKKFDFAVVLKPTMKMIGEFSVADAMYHTPYLTGEQKEISLLANEKFQRKGYMTECGKGMIKYLFENHNVDAVFSRAYATNNPSLKFSKYCGMKVISTDKEYIGQKGLVDIVTNGITIEEFKHSEIYKNVKYKLYDEQFTNERVRESLAKKYLLEKRKEQKKTYFSVKELFNAAEKQEIFLDKSF